MILSYESGAPVQTLSSESVPCALLLTKYQFAPECQEFDSALDASPSLR